MKSFLSFLTTPIFMSAPSTTTLAKQIKDLQKQIDDVSARLPDPPKPSRFIDNGDGTVTDKETNLTWMKEDDGKRRTWEDAKEYCEKVKLPGKGWRLPTVKELISIVDYDKHGPCIDPVFIDTQTAYYWSSTPFAGDSGNAWIVNFSYGNVYWYHFDYEYYVRPVRQNS